MVRIEIDGRTAEVATRTTILDAARGLGIAIPTLCYHPDLTPVGSCRLCLVEVEGLEREVPACRQPVMDGMIVRTTSAALMHNRRMVLQLLLGRYSGDDASSQGIVETEFMRWVRELGVEIPQVGPALAHSRDSDPNPFIQVDLNKCILCTRCIRACDEIQGRFVWHLSGRGGACQVVPGHGTTMLDARCESCGACAAYCPTGALLDRDATSAGVPDKIVTTTCGYCGVGCQFDLNVKANRVTRVTSNPAAPVNGMSLCVKGRYGHAFIHHPERLTAPRVREYLLETHQRRPDSGRGDWVEVDWPTALGITAHKLRDIKQASGPSAIGVLASAKCTNEENYLLQKLARQVLGTNHIDHCARLCHASTVAGLQMAFGTGAMSNSMSDVANRSAAIFIIGSNTTEQHPVFGTMIRRAVLNRGIPLVVADPRQVDITEFATLHLRHAPGTDTALLNGIAHVILREGWQDQDFIDRRCENFEPIRAALAPYDPRRVETITGVPAKQIVEAARILSGYKPMAVIWAMGITQHTSGVQNVLALANLQMLLGNLGVPGGGVNPLRGQNNVQGACDMGALPDVFPGYQSVTDAAVQRKFLEAWKLSAKVAGDYAGTPAFSGKSGLTVTELIDGAGAGKIRALYILGEDPAMTEPNVGHVRKCLDLAEFVALQEIFPSETSAYADVLLPGSSFAEKDGTFTNTERRVQLVREAIEAPGEARADWVIIANLAQLLIELDGRQPTGKHARWDHKYPEQIMAEIAELTPSYAGVTHDRLRRGDDLQWPVTDLQHRGTPILHCERFPRGRGRFHPVEYLPPAEQPDSKFPFLLTTGRVLYHWHGGELTRRVQGLLEVCPDSLLEIHPADADRLDIDLGQELRLRSRRGEMAAHALITSRVAPGVVFGNFHFPGPHNVNNLTNDALDPTAKIPEYKACAVSIAHG